MAVILKGKYPINLVKKSWADLEDQRKRHLVADEKYVDFGCLVLDVANRASEIYQVRKPEEKKYLCNLVFSNLFLADKTVKFSLNTIFQAVLKYQETKDWLSTPV